jgi:hypothetical protein
MKIEKLAFDRMTVRTKDVDGKLHIETSHISKAAVNPYYGHEIPDYETLGLEPNKIYMLLRDPVELQKAALTFNRLQVLSKHIPSFVGINESEWKPFVVGTTGTDAEFVHPHLNNSLTIWDAVAIAGIEKDVQKEISCGYRYTPVMIPGEYEGQKYDGVMTDIIGNHVALVESGRAGSDVVVGDKNPFLELFDMSKTSRKAVAVKAGIGAYLLPKLAADAAIDLKAIVGLPKAATIAEDAKRIAAAVVVATTGKLAADAKLAADELEKVIKAAAEAESDKEEDEEMAKDEDEEDMANDEDKDESDKVSKPAMDAAIAAAVKATEARLQSIRRAEQEVRPVIGDIVAQDSAATVYKMALDHLKVDLTGVDPSLYGTLYRTVSAVKPQKSTIAQDAAKSSGAFTELFPTAKLTRSY